MIFKDLLKNPASVFLFLLFSTLPLIGQNSQPEWRKWTSSDGSEIEAYLKEVSPNGIVIVRRDGREFTVSPGRFSATDQAYIQEWREKKAVQPSADDFGEINFLTAPAPEVHEIADVEQVRLGSGEVAESGAIKTILKFLKIPADPNLSQRLAVRKSNADVAIRAADLEAVLAPLPVGMKGFVLPPPAIRNMRRSEDRSVLNAIRKAISLDLPVLIAYRPEVSPDTPEVIGTAVRYDRRTLYLIEAEGNRKSVPLDWRTLEETLLQAVIIYPLPSKGSGTGQATEEGPSVDFLRKVSAVLQKSVQLNPPVLAERLREQEIDAAIQDINRTDLERQLGNTRSFAFTGGIPQIDTVLDRGAVAVVPQEFDSGNGYALIYGRNGDRFSAVRFFSDGKFERGNIADSDIARLWMTRDDRIYHLYLINLTNPVSDKKSD